MNTQLFYLGLEFGLIKSAKYFKLDLRTKFQGMPVSVENDVGSVRSGTSPDGKEWSTKMKAQYGYLRGTRGVDGDELDVFIGPNADSDKVFIMHMLDPKTGNYDEDKCILGTDSRTEARKLIGAHYDSPKFMGDITEMSIDDFKRTAMSTYWKPRKLNSSAIRRRNPITAPNREWGTVLDSLRMRR